ncbi:MAG: SDR family NAD(P)-dependent oxidoreductase, partial [Caldilineaceae bacterium]
MKTERILVTGGAGFIGSNLVNRLLRQGHHVTIFDNLSRSGCKQNLEWLQQQFGTEALCLVQADLTDFTALQRAATNVERIYHL